MALKSRFTRIAVEGDTTDGRVIDRAWIEQMAKTYNPTKYTARINCEHLRGISPDGPFGAYGTVLELKTDTVEIDGEKKLALMGSVEPTAELVTLNRKGQKLFTSVEIDQDFANSGEAYLVGLAVTDSPASLGTEMLQFAATAQANPLNARKQKPENLFSAAQETTLEFSDDTSILDKVKGMFSSSKQEQNGQNDQFSESIELLASEVADLKKNPGSADFSQKLEGLGEKFTNLETQFSNLTKQLENTPNFTQRPPATGGDGNSQMTTDC